MPQKNIVEKIKTHISCLKSFSRILCHWWDNVEKYWRARDVTDGNIIWCVRFACWIPEATHTCL